MKYYVDARCGDDSNPGTSPEKAFRSVAALVILSASDRVFVKVDPDSDLGRALGITPPAADRELNINSC